MNTSKNIPIILASKFRIFLLYLYTRITRFRGVKTTPLCRVEYEYICAIEMLGVLIQRKLC